MGSPTNVPTASGGGKLTVEKLLPPVTVSARTFVVLYALLGTVQAMVYVYFVGTLTSFERRFRLPSRTTGIILAGNELGQAALSLALLLLKRRIVSRPVCLALAVALSALSCFLLAGPYMGYGSSSLDRHHGLPAHAAAAAARNSTDSLGLGSDWDDQVAAKIAATLVCGDEICLTSPVNSILEPECSAYGSTASNPTSGSGEYGGVPTILGFVAHLLLGAATTIYLSLGQIYVDAGEQKTSLPLLLGLTLSLRAVGPALGFLLAAGCTALYDEQSLVPVINRNDPRWIGAWWLGWFLLGSVLLLFAVPLAVFAKRIRVTSYGDQNILQQATKALPNGKPEKSTSTEPLQAAANAQHDEGVMAGIKRLAKNKIFMCNVWSGVFYILGTCGFLNFITKYMEVQFDLSAAVANLIIGPTSIVAILSGLTIAGLVISRIHPRPRVIMAWNVLVGFCYVFGHVLFIFLGCSDTALQGYNPYSYGSFSLRMQCNNYCQCNKDFNPVCDDFTRVTYFSACYAGCTEGLIDYNVKGFKNCACKGSASGTPFYSSGSNYGYDSVRYGQSNDPAARDYRGRTWEPPRQQWPQQNQPPDTWNSPRDDAWNRQRPRRQVDSWNRGDWNRGSQNYPDGSRGYNSMWNGMAAGPCEPYCGGSLILFILVSFTIQMLGSSGRIGNLLINYRSADPDDKQLAQAVSLILVSVFGLIPGLIIYGVVIDSTCIVWDETCGVRGHCWLYDRSSLRLYFNIVSMIFIALGASLDAAACHLGRNLNLYPNNEEEASQKEEEEEPEESTPSAQQLQAELQQPLDLHTTSSSFV